MTVAAEASTARPSVKKLEVVVIPVSDVERAKQFSQGLGLGSTPTTPRATTTG